jgi:hypothetical protein
MKTTPIFPACILKGKIKMSGADKKKLNVWLESFKTGSVVDVIIRKHINKSTDKQRGYYFGVVVEILSDHFGYELDEMHEELKLKFNPVKSKLSGGKTIGGSTTELLRDKYFGDEQSYVSRICRWAAGEGVYIPEPNKVEQ